MEIKYINIFKGADLSERKLPILIERSKEPGPAIWLSAGIHGDEVTGIEVIQRIFNYLKRRPLKRGTLYALPLVNPMGFEMIKRENPYDDEDINRNFPGDENGSTTERLTNAVFNSIIETKPDLVIDLHADTQNSLPYIIIERPVSTKTGVKEALEKSWDLAEKFGVTVVYEIGAEGYKKYRIDQCMTAALVNRNQILAFVVELGGPRIIDEKLARMGVRGVKNILLHFKMIDENEKQWVSETKINSPEKLELIETITSKESGIVKYLVEPGQFIKKGTPMLRVTNVLGKIEEIIFAERDCYIISLCDSSVSFPGVVLLSIAVPLKAQQHDENKIPLEVQPKSKINRNTVSDSA